MERGLVRDKDETFIVVTEGRVLVDGQKAISPAARVAPDATIEVRSPQLYVGRGAYKLEAALDRFGVTVAGKICADVGAAIGGFTEVLLLRGARRIYTIDTARGKLAWKLRQDPRVVVMEGKDIRAIAALPELLEIISIDVSLVSLREILPAVEKLIAPNGIVVTLLKPQYETRDQKMLYHGVVKRREDREALRDEIIAWARENGWLPEEWMESPIRGAKGNVEYLVSMKLNEKR